MLLCGSVKTASGMRRLKRHWAILTQSVKMIVELQTKSATFFAQVCLNRLRSKWVSRCQHSEIALKVFAKEEGAVPKW